MAGVHLLHQQIQHHNPRQQLQLKQQKQQYQRHFQQEL
jgi:hypothetical protein